MTRAGQPPLPFVAGQRGLWTETLQNKDNGFHIQQVVWRVLGEASPNAIAAAWRDVVARHENFRLAAGLNDAGVLCQWIESDVVPVLEHHNLEGDLDSTTLDEIVDQERRLVAAAARAPFWRACWIQGSPPHVVWTFHHAIADGRSTWRAIEELYRSYEARLTGAVHRFASLPPLADWVAQRPAPPADARIYWAHLLAGMPTTGAPWPPALTPSGPPNAGYRELREALDARTTGTLKDWARQNDLTLNAVLMSAWLVVWGAYRDSQDLVIGTVRATGAASGPLGFFANTLPLRAKVAAQSRFDDLAARVRAQWRAGYPFRSAPLHEIQRWTSEMPRGRPMFQSIVAFETRRPITTLGDRESASRWSDFRLIRRPSSRLLIYGFDGDRLAIVTGYDAQYVDHDAARSLSHHLIETLERVAAAGGAIRVGDLQRPGDRLHRAILRNTRSVARRDPPATVHAVFAAQARRDPDRQALVWDDGSLTYRALDRRSDRFAARLARRGVARGDLICVSIARSPEAIVALLAILKLGAAYVPLNPDEKPERRRAVINHGQIRVVCTDGLSSRGFRVPGVTVIQVGDDDTTRPHVATNAHVDGNDLAYVMSTSGSTGTPKMVAVPHEAVTRLILGGNYARFGADEVFLHASSSAFDASTFEIWGALLHGATLALPPPGPFDLEVLATTIRKHQVTTLWLTAGLFHLVALNRPRTVDGVRQLLAGGDVLSCDDIAHLREAQPHCRLINGYGPTEATTFTTCCDLNALPTLDRSVPIGTPIAHTRTYVVGPDGALQPPGFAGELWIGGGRLARGYFADPRRTAARFVPDPWCTKGGRRVYRSGDQVRCRWDAQLTFLGRRDRQVKIRGFRVELDEVERELQRCATVASAAVLSHGATPATRRLVGYVVAEDEATTGADIKRELAERVPGALVPHEIVLRSALPLTSSGKLDRKQLRPIGPRGAVRQHTSPTSDTVSALFADILGHATVDPESDFFELGGDSLDTMRLLAAIQRRHGTTLTSQWLFDHGRPVDIIERLEIENSGDSSNTDSSNSSDSDSSESLGAFLHRGYELGRKNGEIWCRNAHGALADVPPAARGSRVWTTLTDARFAPASTIQEHFHFVHTLHGGATDNVSVVFDVATRIDVERFQRTLAQLDQEHDLLRTTFHDWDGYLVQSIHNNHASVFAHSSLVSFPHEKRREVLRERLEVASNHRFDLACETPLRVKAWELAPKRWTVLFLWHHITVDEIAIQHYLGRLGKIYDGLTARKVVPVRPPNDSYLRYCLAEKAGHFRRRSKDDLAFWRTTAKRTPTLPEALGLPAPPPGAVVKRRWTFPLSPETSSGLEALARGERCTLFMVETTLLAAWVMVWGRLDRVAFGVPISQRFASGQDDTFGPFITTLPVPVAGDRHQNLRGLLRTVRQSILETAEHPWTSPDRLARALEIGHSTWGPELFTAIITPSADRGSWLSLNGARARPVDGPQSTPKSAVTIFFRRREDGITISIEADERAFDPGLARSLGEGLATMADRAVTDANQTLLALAALPANSHRSLVKDGPIVDPDRAVDGAAVHDILGAIAQARGDQVAVCSQTERLTYAELEAQATAVGKQLIHAGVVRGDAVGVQMARSIAMVIGLVAILKAGGAYVPLDPRVPVQRLHRMFVDTDIRFVLVDAVNGDTASVPNVVFLEIDPSAVTPELPLPAIEPQDIAYIMHTSGSTGVPKAVAVRHGGVVELIRNSGCADFGQDVVMLQLSILAFDASTFEIWGALLHGARLVLMPTGPPTFDAIRRIVAEHDVTMALLPTGLFHFVVHEQPSVLRGLEHVLVGGDVLARDDVDAFYAAFPDGRLINAYGPTEVTTITTCHPLSTDAVTRQRVPIGRPVGHTRVAVVGPDLDLLPKGLVGELLIGGSRLARGYVGRPDLTAERFIPDPFATEPGARVYRSGDRVRWEADDTLTFVGRADRQVKIRGFRIELDDLEHALRRIDGVKDALVAARGSSAESRRLHAYVVPMNANDIHLPALRSAIVREVPAYMVPQEIVVVEALCLTAAGKIDRRALVPLAVEPERLVAAPLKRMEELLAQIWRPVLGVETIRADDDFFALGGTSLDLIRVLASIRQRFDIEVPIHELYTSLDLTSMAKTVRTRMRAPLLDAAIDQRAAGALETIEILSRGPDPRRTLLCLHPVGGSLLDYRDLARTLKSRDIGLLGIPSPGLTHGSVPSSVRASARHYLKCLAELDLRQTPVLLGYCTGGFIALEMARQLGTRRGQAQAVILVDVPLPRPRTPGADRDAAYRGTYLFAREIRLDLVPDDLHPLALTELKSWVWNQFESEFTGEARGLGFAHFERLYETYVGNFRASQRFIPRPGPTRLVVLEAKDTKTPSHQEWRGLFPDARCRRIPGNHITCLRDPAVTTTASVVAEELDRVLGISS